MDFASTPLRITRLRKYPINQEAYLELWKTKWIHMRILYLIYIVTLSYHTWQLFSSV